MGKADRNRTEKLREQAGERKRKKIDASRQWCDT